MPAGNWPMIAFGHRVRVDRIRIGLAVRALRRRARLTQAALGRRIGVSGSAISRIERGGADRSTWRLLERVTTELGARLVVSVQWQAEGLDRLLDAEHARLVEWAIRWLTGAGWEAVPEVTFRIGGERGSIDVLARHRSGALLVIEVKTAIADAQGLLATLDRKARLSRSIARDRGWLGVTTISRLLIAPADRTIRRRIDGLGATFSAALPARSIEVRRWASVPRTSLAGILLVPNVTVTGARHRILASR